MFGRMTAGALMLAALCARAESDAKSASPAKWNDWPCFLGPERNGSSPEKGLLREWPEGGPKVLWKTPVGRGYGAPSVSRGEAFFLGSTATGRCVWCLDAFTGEVRWQFKYDTRKEDKLAAKRIVPGWGYCPRATVTPDDACVYSIDEIGELYCLDRKTGKEIWFRDLDTDYKPDHNDWKGWCASPVLSAGIVVLPVFSGAASPGQDAADLAGLDAKTGKTVWEYADKLGAKETKRTGGGSGALFVTPLPVDFGGERCVLWPGRKGLAALKVEDGKKVWEYADKVPMGWQMSPQIKDNQVYLGRLLNVDRTTRPFETRVLWEPAFPYGAYTYSIPVRCGDYLYAMLYMQNSCIGDHGSLHNVRLSCIDAKTGQEVWKKEDLPHGASIMTADGLLFVRAGNSLYLLEATADGYREKGKVGGAVAQDLSGWVMPALAYGRLFVRYDGQVVCHQAAVDLPSREQIGVAEGSRK